MKNLAAIGMNYNEIENIPDEIGECSELKWIHFDYNKIKGNFPTGLLKLNKL